MGDVDAGNVKAKASIEYDPSGLKQMKEDLASLSDTLGGGLEQNTQRASDALSGLGESMSGSAGGAKEFSAALEELPKIAESGASGISEMSGVLEEHRAAVEEAGTAYESLQKPVETVTSSLEKAAPAMQTVSEHTRGLNENLSQAHQSFSDLSAAIAEPGATEAYTNLWKSVSGESLDASPLGNLEVFQRAYSNFNASGLSDVATGMQMIDTHLEKTGQSYEQFSGSLSERNQELFHRMSMDWSQMNVIMDDAGQSFQKTGTQAQTGFNTIASASDNADQAVSEFLGKTTKGVNEVAGGMKPVTIGGAFGEAFSSVTGFLNEIAMPLMAVQMIGMAVQQVAQSMYDSAAIAEGPAAHSFGTFTGTVDALGQSLQRTGGQFSEGFGKEFLPTLNALNNQAGSGDGGWLGQLTGGVASTIANLTMITTGVDPWGGVQGLINQGAEVMGLPQPFQGPPPTPKYQQYMAAMPQTIRDSTTQTQEQANLLMEEASDPAFLAQQQQLQAAQTIYQRAQQDYNIRHPVNLQKMKADAQSNLYAQQQAENYQYQMDNQPSIWQQMPGSAADLFGGIGNYLNTPTGSLLFGGISPTGLMNSIGSKGGIDQWLSGITTPTGDILSGIFGGHNPTLGDMWGGVSNMFGGIGQWFNGLFGGGDATPPTFTGGCFVAGTPVLLADGREKPIETLQVGEQVLAHDGEKHVTTTILATMKPAPKRVYKLTFDDGRTLTLTNAHPLQGVDGWKSLSPEATALENPGLEVTPLVVGDVIQTVNGTCTLTSILPLQGVRQIYNIEVGEPHTFYAAGILAHNKIASSVGSMSNGGVGSEQVQLSHTFTANIQWEANNLTKQFTGVAQWAGQNLANTFMGAASWVGQNLANTFQGAASWVGQNLSNTFQGAASWVAQGLQNTFQGATDWVAQGLSNTFHGAADWVGEGLQNTFKGIASWNGQGLEHTFTGVANWVGQNLNPTFTVNPSFTMLAEGTSNWGGGPAIVGEAGPEVVEHNGQYSMFDAGATLLNLPQGANVYPMKNLQSSGVAQFADGTGGNYTLPLNIGIPGSGMPQSINVNVHLDSQTILSAVEIPMAQNIRVASGLRSY